MVSLLHVRSMYCFVPCVDLAMTTCVTVSVCVRADGVVKELSSVIKCRSLFSTHYHTLMPDFQADPAIYLAHMGCLADSDADESRTDLDITFLYTLTDGACPQRYASTFGLINDMSFEFTWRSTGNLNN